MFYMLNMRIINFATICYILLQSKSRETPESTPQFRADDRAIYPMEQALFPMRSAVRGLSGRLATPQTGLRRRACSAEAFLSAFLEKQLGFHNSSEMLEDCPTGH